MIEVCVSVSHWMVCIPMLDLCIYCSVCVCVCVCVCVYCAVVCVCGVQVVVEDANQLRVGARVWLKEKDLYGFVR